ncbi:hypothetical protein [Mucilaginibacter sp.]|uniref:hypothetical protein n=1 Tax=Mucilaginibacter sp. TaxID=1882438 RepID=UPI0035BC7824
MYEIYKIKETDLHAAAWRTIKKAIKLMVVIYIIFTVYIIWQDQLSLNVILTCAIGILPAYTLALLIAYSLLKSIYRTLRVVVDDDGVEFYIRGNDKKISWSNLRIVKQENGTIQLQYKHISAMFSKLTG